MGEKESNPKLMKEEVALTLSWAKTLIDIAAPKEWVSVAFLNPHVPFLPPRASNTFLSSNSHRHASCLNFQATLLRINSILATRDKFSSKHKYL